MLDILKDPYFEGIMVIIIDILYVVIEHTVVFPPHLIFKLKPWVALHFYAVILDSEFIVISVLTVYHRKLSELVHEHFLWLARVPFFTGFV